MPLTLDGTNGVSAVQAGSIQSDDLAAGVGGKVLQVVHNTTSTMVASTSTSFVDSGLSASITPQSSNNNILIQIDQFFQQKRTSGFIDLLKFKLLRDSTQVGSSISEIGYMISNNVLRRITTPVSTSFFDSPSSTSSLNYKTQFALRVNTSDAEIIANANAEANDPGAVFSAITLMEIAG